MEWAHERVKDILRSHHPKPLSDDQENAMDEVLEEATVTLLKKQ